MSAFEPLKRQLLGRPLNSNAMGDTLLPKWLALPVFCSDPLSSVAYATEQILFVLGAGIGAGFLHNAPYIAGAVALLLVVVVASYRQTCYAYPSGGGAYIVSNDNLGKNAALTAAAALLVDYVLTVAVSVVAGVAALISAAPSLSSHAVLISVLLVALLAVVNLRGVKESGKAFAIPTYLFIALTISMIGIGIVKRALGDLDVVPPLPQDLRVAETARTGGILTVLLILRAFASGCTALTGVEAISNGVPAFRRPASRNAAQTLLAMGTLAISMFIGVTYLAVEMHATAAEFGVPSVISTIAKGVFGDNVVYYLFQASTGLILVLAANTAFNGFPLLASILAQDRYLPRQLHTRGDRLVFSNGVLLLAAAAIGLIFAFDAKIDSLIQLYIVGVFVSFTLSQYGMVKHWTKLVAAERDRAARDGGQPVGIASYRRSQAINGLGAVVTLLVLIVVAYSKFTHGAYLAILAMGLMFAVMFAIRKHYDNVSIELNPLDEAPVRPSQVHAIVLVSKVHRPALRALAFARAMNPGSLEAVTVNVDQAETDHLRDDWEARGLAKKIPLRELDSPYRDITRPVIDFVRDIRRDSPRDLVCVFIPEYVVGRWWEQFLHNQSALRLKGRLLFLPGVMVTSVPFRLESSQRHPDAVPGGVSPRRDAGGAVETGAGATPADPQAPVAAPVGAVTGPPTP